MRSKEELKHAICQEIDARRDEIFEIGDVILRNPEMGFKETKTAALVARKFADLGLSYREGLAISGVKARVACARPGPTVAVLGELDALLVPQHPLADPRTGAAHACGHNAQIAAMLGAAAGLLRTGALDHLDGNVVFFAVPAEELVEVEYRMTLRERGKIEFLGGKQELIRLGEFDDIDMAMLVHANPRREERLSGVHDTYNGCIAKTIQYVGKAAHAGSQPHIGVNALNAATIALHAIHTQRETFRDEDTVRVHPIITKGGDLVNVVPADVRMETFVRGKTVEAIENADEKVDRCLRAGAMAVGAKVLISTISGYAPLANHHGLAEVYKRNCVQLVGEDEWAEGGHRAGSTDMGDVSLIMPALHPDIGGVTGVSHGADFLVSDPDTLYLTPAKAMAMTIVDLLYSGAEEARCILASNKPRFTKDEYLAFMRRMTRAEEYPV